MDALKLWLSLASRAEKEDLAARASTSVAQLYHLSGGVRRASAEKGGAIAVASVALNKKNPDLPILTRMDICPACALCEYTNLLS